MSYINGIDVVKLTSTANQLDTALKELRSRVSQCEISINHLHQAVFGYRNNNIINSLQEQLDAVEIDINDYKCAIAGEISEIRADLDAYIRQQDEKSDLEILEQNSENEVKNYFIDMDLVKDEQLWEPYGPDWWNQ